MDYRQNPSLRPAVGSTETINSAEPLPAVASISADSPHPDRKIVNFSHDGAKVGTNYPQSRPPACSDSIAVTDFEALPDGSLLDLVATREAAPRLRLLHWSRSGSTIGDRLRLGGMIFELPQWGPSFLRAVRLPADVKPSGGPRALFNRISEILRAFIDLPDEILVRVVVYVLATWFPESQAVAPLLWITGPPASGKTTLLRLLNCLCRRPLLVTDIRPAALYSLPALLKPTLLIDECEFGRSGPD